MPTLSQAGTASQPGAWHRYGSKNSARLCRTAPVAAGRRPPDVGIRRSARRSAVGYGYESFSPLGYLGNRQRWSRLALARQGAKRCEDVEVLLVRWRCELGLPLQARQPGMHGRLLHEGVCSFHQSPYLCSESLYKSMTIQEGCHSTEFLVIWVHGYPWWSAGVAVGIAVTWYLEILPLRELIYGLMPGDWFGCLAPAWLRRSGARYVRSGPPTS